MAFRKRISRAKSKRSFRRGAMHIKSKNFRSTGTARGGIRL